MFLMKTLGMLYGCIVALPAVASHSARTLAYDSSFLINHLHTRHSESRNQFILVGSSSQGQSEITQRLQTSEEARHPDFISASKGISAYKDPLESSYDRSLRKRVAKTNENSQVSIEIPSRNRNSQDSADRNRRQQSGGSKNQSSRSIYNFYNAVKVKLRKTLPAITKSSKGQTAALVLGSAVGSGLAAGGSAIGCEELATTGAAIDTTCNLGVGCIQGHDALGGEQTAETLKQHDTKIKALKTQQQAT